LIDHGVCFHVDDKLRTVIWDFVGEPLPAELCDDIQRFQKNLEPARDGSLSELASTLLPYISREEIFALADRADALLASGRFPPPSPFRRPYPWPQI
jgi:hypothetical protein